MNPRDLDPSMLREVGALTPENGCSIFALASAMAFVDRSLSKEKIIQVMNGLITTKIEDTPLLLTAQTKKLPPPLFSPDGSVYALHWINEGAGGELMDFLNTRFLEEGVDLRVGFFSKESLSRCLGVRTALEMGSAVLLPITVHERTRDTGHHFAVGKEGSDYIVMDINSRGVNIAEELLSEMLFNPEKKVRYLGREDLEFSVDTDPVIFVEKITF